MISGALDVIITIPTQDCREPGVYHWGLETLWGANKPEIPEETFKELEKHANSTHTW